jgi:hypothetical protein
MKGVVLKKIGVNLDKYKLVGHPKKTIKYYFYYLIERKVFVSKHVTF